MSDTATKQGTTIEVVAHAHDDYTVAWDVKITDSFGGVAIVPTFSVADEAHARRIANTAYALVTPNVSATELRSLALADLKARA